MYYHLSRLVACAAIQSRFVAAVTIVAQQVIHSVFVLPLRFFQTKTCKMNDDTETTHSDDRSVDEVALNWRDEQMWCEMILDMEDIRLEVDGTIDEAIDAISRDDDEYHSLWDDVVSCQCRDCSACGIRDCPARDPLHYHHDGCPAGCTEPGASAAE